MGSTNSRYVSESELSQLDTDEEFDTIESSTNEEIDAALRPTVSMPRAQDVLTVNKVIEFERDLDNQEIASLVYLLSEDPKESRYLLDKLYLMTRGGDRTMLSQWAEYNSSKGNWQDKLIEALCIIKNFNVLKSLGFEKSSVIDHFLPNNANSLHVNIIKKSVYLICDNLCMREKQFFLNKVKENFHKRKINFDELEVDHLEICFLQWECDKVLDLYEIKGILKGINEDHLYNILDKVLLKQQNVTNNRETQSTSFEFPNNSQSLRDAMNLGYNQKESRSRKPSTGTSMDNNFPREHFPYVNPFLEHHHNLPPLDFQNNVSKDNNPLVDPDSNSYPVDPENPGIVLIINQMDFYSEFRPNFQHLLSKERLQERAGSKNDRDRLEKEFKKYGFKVIVYDSINHQELKQTVIDVTNQIKDESSLFICIMSHGDKGIVYGSNSCYVQVSKIQEIMTSYNKANLTGKPKFLILQSCQGQQCQQLESLDEDSESHMSLATDGPKPTLRDLYTFWATVPGFAAIRHKKNGSWFIQALCKNMSKYGNKHHFADICTRVKRDVTEQVWENERVTKIMTPIDDSTLVKFFYLPPKLEES